MDKECHLCKSGQNQFTEEACLTCGIEKVNWDPANFHICSKCKKYPECKGDTCLSGEWFDANDITSIAFPILNGLKPTTVSCTFKVLEELGELVQLIGKHSGLSGETPTISDEVRIRRTVFEALDVAQAAVTMANTFCDLHDLSLESFVEKHREKLVKKGYLVEKKTTPKIDPTWKVCENCNNIPTTNEIPEICERCEDNEWGTPSNFTRRKR